jgi:hypothetical protein
MLIGCLTAVIVSAYAPWYVGVLAGLVAGGIVGAIAALFITKGFGGKGTPPESTGGGGPDQ